MATQRERGVRMGQMVRWSVKYELPPALMLHLPRLLLLLAATAATF